MTHVPATVLGIDVLHVGRISSSGFSIGGFFQYGDEVRYQENPFLGRGAGGGMFATIRPVPRFQSQINLNASRLIDPRVDPSTADPLVFDVQIVRRTDSEACRARHHATGATGSVRYSGARATGPTGP